MLRRIAGALCSVVLCAVLSACGGDATPTANSGPAMGVSPQVTSQPANQTVAVGATATFTVAATGTAPLSFQWMLNDAAIAGATGNSYTTPAVTAGDSGESFSCVVSNSSGSATSNAAVLTVSSLPQITVQPASQTVTAGQTATFSVTASGTAITYQWSRNNAAIAGATQSSYTTAATTSADNGATFSVVISNAYGSVTSATAVLAVTTVTVAPQIIVQPASQSVIAGQTATFSVSASGTDLTYQWSRNGAAIAGATLSSYTTAATTSADNGATFSVVISNAGGSVTSTTATLTVNSPPQITTQPASQTVRAGQSATFSVSASGTALTYQWSRNGAPISGAMQSTYTTAATTSADNGASFSVVVSNAGGSVTSTTATLTVNSPPQITAQPASQTVRAGQTATFSITASGTALTYQWSRSGAPISGATQSSYTTAATTSADNGATFSVVVTNAGGSVTSTTATLTVNSPPQITTQPSSQTVTVGQTATFSVTASGSTLTYQWSRSGAPIAGATQSSYTTGATISADNGATFSVVISNAGGSVTSNIAMLTVNAATVAPQITTQPANGSVTVGQTATFAVVATGSPTPTYQWKKNGAVISGATGASYTTPATVIGDNGSMFTVVVTNSVGSATSNAATLTVTATQAGTNVLTYKNDVLRSGLNSTETVLTPANVNSTNFGLLRNLSVDSYVDAQPLYVSQLSISGASHNVVFVATENNSVYAFDSDTGATLWLVSLNGTHETPSDTRGCTQVEPTIGITSTPVIDLNAGPNGTLFAVAMTKDQSGNYHQRLHALDLTTGGELSGAPTEITATYGSTSFAPGQYEERAGLLLSNGTIYTTYSSHCDQGTYGGWIIAFGENTYAITGSLNVAPGASGSGYGNEGPAIWMADGGPAADAAGNVYLLTGNGRFETTLTNGFPSGGDYGNSFLKLTLSGGSPAVADYFTMSNEVNESAGDTDLGSGGILLLPDMTDSTQSVRHLAIGAGKDGNLYVVNRDNMGGFNASSNNNQISQYLPGTLSGGIYSTPAYFNGTLYYGPVGGHLLALPVVEAVVAASSSSNSPSTFGYPGTSPVVSANGTANGIVWAYEKNSVAVLHAYDATNLSTELYNSTQAAGSRDQFGAPNKFITVTVADGKVFAASTNSVAVFGLLP